LVFFSFFQQKGMTKANEFLEKNTRMQKYFDRFSKDSKLSNSAKERLANLLIGDSFQRNKELFLQQAKQEGMNYLSNIITSVAEEQQKMLNQEKIILDTASEFVKDKANKFLSSLEKFDSGIVGQAKGLYAHLRPSASHALALISRFNFQGKLLLWAVSCLIFFCPFFILTGDQLTQFVKIKGVTLALPMHLIPGICVIFYLSIFFVYFHIGGVRSAMRHEEELNMRMRMMALEPVKWAEIQKKIKDYKKDHPNSTLHHDTELHALLDEEFALSLLHRHDHHEVESDMPCHACEGLFPKGCLHVIRHSGQRGFISWMLGTSSDTHGDRLPAWAPIFIYLGFLYLICVLSASTWELGAIVCYSTVPVGYRADGLPDVTNTTCGGLSLKDLNLNHTNLYSYSININPLTQKEFAEIDAFEPGVSTVLTQFVLYFASLAAVATVLAWTTSTSATQLICKQLVDHIREVQREEQIATEQKLNKKNAKENIAKEKINAIGDTQSSKNAAAEPAPKLSQSTTNNLPPSPLLKPPAISPSDVANNLTSNTTPISSSVNPAEIVIRERSDPNYGMKLGCM
jgi:hypothetical protein